MNLHGPSYKLGAKLAAEGCPLDFLNALPRRTVIPQKRLQMREIDGHVENRLYDLGPNRGSAYVIGLHLATELTAGITIDDWYLQPPWEGHHITWDYSPENVLPPGDRLPYEHVFNSRLSDFLDGRIPLRRGRPIEGLLVGFSLQSLPASVPTKGVASAKFSVTLASGDMYVLGLSLSIIHAHPKPVKRRPRPRLFETRLMKDDAGQKASAPAPMYREPVFHTQSELDARLAELIRQLAQTTPPASVGETVMTR